MRVRLPECTYTEALGYLLSGHEVWCIRCAINVIEDLKELERKEIVPGLTIYVCSNCGCQMTGQLAPVDYEPKD